MIQLRYMKYQQRFILLLIVLLCLIIHTSYSQTNKIDSLKKIVQTGRKDTVMVKNLNSLSKETLYNFDITESINISQQALELAKQLGYLSGEAYAEKNIGIAYYYQGDYKQVADHWNKSLEIFESIEDPQGISNLINNLATLFWAQGSFSVTIDYYLRSLSLAEKIQDTLRIATALINISRVHQDDKDYDKALEYLNRIRPYLPGLKDSQVNQSYFMSAGKIFSMQGNYEDALKFYQDALPFTISTLYHSENLIQLGIVEFKMGDSSKAIEFLNQAYQNAKKDNQELNMLLALIELGKVYQNNDFPKAFRAFKEAEPLPMQMKPILNYRTFMKDYQWLMPIREIM